MKVKDCEKFFEEYDNNCNDIQIGIDNTDHIVFICKKCKNPLEIIEVSSKNIDILKLHQKKDNCTWIWTVCHNCKTFGKRKFYWKSEDGRFCFNRTKEGGEFILPQSMK